MLRYNEAAGWLTRIYCGVCAKHADQLKCLHNYSPSFISGVTVIGLRILDQKCTNKLLALLRSLNTCTIGRAFASVSGEDRDVACF